MNQEYINLENGNKVTRLSLNLQQAIVGKTFSINKESNMYHIYVFFQHIFL